MPLSFPITFAGKVNAQSLAMGGGINEFESTVASAATPDIFALTVGNTINYTGVVRATGFAAAPQAGPMRRLVCAGACSFLAGANMIIAGTPSGSVFQAAANDVIEVYAFTTTQFFLAPLKNNGLSPLGFQQITASLGANVALNVAANFFDGPSIAQGTVGVWWVSGTISLSGTSGDNILVKLWDGTTTIAGTQLTIPAGNLTATASLSGFLSAPAGNLRISARDTSNVTGLIVFNATGTSKDSTISAIRIG